MSLLDDYEAQRKAGEMLGLPPTGSVGRLDEEIDARMNAHLASAFPRSQQDVPSQDLGGGQVVSRDLAPPPDVPPFAQQQLPHAPFRPDIRLPWKMQYEQIAQHGRAEAQAWLAQQEMTQAEATQLRKMQQAVSTIQNDPTLSADEKTYGVLQLKTGIDFMKQKQAATQAKMMSDQHQQQAALYKAQTDAVLGVQHGIEDTHQAILKGQWKPIMIPDSGGSEHPYQWNPKTGMMELLETPKAEKANESKMLAPHEYRAAAIKEWNLSHPPGVDKAGHKMQQEPVPEWYVEQHSARLAREHQAQRGGSAKGAGKAADTHIPRAIQSAGAAGDAEAVKALTALKALLQKYPKGLPEAEQPAAIAAIEALKKYDPTFKE